MNHDPDGGSLHYLNLGKGIFLVQAALKGFALDYLVFVIAIKPFLLYQHTMSGISSVTDNKMIANADVDTHDYCT